MNEIRKPTTGDVTLGALPASEKFFVGGERLGAHKVPMRRIFVHESAKEKPLVVYDTTGAYTDPAAHIDIEAGLPRLRGEWIIARGDTEEYPARPVQLQDNGGATGEKLVPEFPSLHRPRRAIGGK
ncbi:MAG: phosphomethylpyrimidine synthase ThiC, partial [Proteobacteria bacterium]|nr:phosphomethylpyrimidine synthase ThiC [Pseudomonadota bacterium]